MKDTEKGLKEALSKVFIGHGQRLTMMSKLVLAVVKMCTVNFAQLALVLNVKVKPLSNFKRIQRFMKSYSFCQRCFVQFAWSLYGYQGQWIALSMDRTNWQFGRSSINMLTIGISWRGTAIPLVWMMLDKRGQSSQKERIILLEQLLSCLNPQQVDRIRYLLMDREFTGHDWIKYLCSKPFGFVLRVRKDANVTKPGQRGHTLAWKLFQDYEFRALRKPRIIFGLRLYIAGQRLSDQEFLVLVSNCSLHHGRHIYSLRWGIEIFFRSCKSKGFNFEDSHVTKLDRINTMTYVLAIAFIWALKTGEMLLEQGHRITIKRVKQRRTKLFSIFRIGLQYMKRKLLNFLSLYDEIIFLSCTQATGTNQLG